MHQPMLVPVLVIASMLVHHSHGYGSYVGILPHHFVQGAVPETERNTKFLEGAPQSKMDEYHQLIASNLDLTEAEMDKKIAEWVSKQSPEIQKKWAEKYSLIPGRIQKKEKEHQETVAKYSPEAKKADAQLYEISQNPTLSIRQKQQQIRQILDSLPESIRNELTSE